MDQHRVQQEMALPFASDVEGSNEPEIRPIGPFENQSIAERPSDRMRRHKDPLGARRIAGAKTFQLIDKRIQVTSCYCEYPLGPWETSMGELRAMRLARHGAEHFVHGLASRSAGVPGARWAKHLEYTLRSQKHISDPAHCYSVTEFLTVLWTSFDYAPRSVECLTALRSREQLYGGVCSAFNGGYPSVVSSLANHIPNYVSYSSFQTLPDKFPNADFPDQLAERKTRLDHLRVRIS